MYISQIVEWESRKITTDNNRWSKPTIFLFFRYRFPSSLFSELETYLYKLLSFIASPQFFSLSFTQLLIYSIYLMICSPTFCILMFYYSIEIHTISIRIYNISLHWCSYLLLKDIERIKWNFHSQQKVRRKNNSIMQ